MKSCSGPLSDYLNNTRDKAAIVADLYTFTLINGTILRYSSYDRELSVGGSTYTAYGPRINRSKIKWTIGTKIDTLDLTIASQQSDLINGTPLIQAVIMGAFDGALLQMDRLFMQYHGDTTLGTVTLFYGRVADCEIDRLEISMKVDSYKTLLNVQLPKHLIQAGCVHSLYDAGCTLDKASFAYNYEVYRPIDRSNFSVLADASLSGNQSFFSYGYLVFTSGSNNGVVRAVKADNWGNAPSYDLIPRYRELTFTQPLAIQPAAGDTFTLYPGCDKQQSTCSGKFSNGNNFRGFPYVPVPESAVTYVG